MEENIEQEGLKHLEHIEEELAEIKERTGSTKRSFVSGLLQGMGWVLGSIVALILIGWVLYAFGLLPGLSGIAAYLQNIVGQYRGR